MTTIAPAMEKISSPIKQLAARAAFSAALCHKGILGVVFVTAWAMSFCAFACGASSSADTSSNVNQMGNKLQMARVDAASHAAQVVWFQSRWNWTTKNLISGAVGQVCSPETKGSVSAAVEMSHPDPASSFGDHFHMAHESPRKRYACRLGSSHGDSPIIALVRLTQRFRAVVSRSYFNPGVAA